MDNRAEENQSHDHGAYHAQHEADRRAKVRWDILCSMLADDAPNPVDELRVDDFRHPLSIATRRPHG